MFIGIAAVCALLATGIFTYIFNQVFKQVPVLVAVKEINQGDPLTAEMFKEERIPVGGVPKTALKPPVNFKEKGYISAKGMSEGDVLRKVNVIDLQDRELSVLSSRLKALEKKGYVAIEVPIDSVEGMLGGMKAGDKVIVGVAYADKDKELQLSSKNPQFVSEVITEAAHVVGIKNPGESKGALIIAVTTEDYLKYMQSKERGKIYVGLRPFGY